ncbi:MAG: hypothetical protein EXS17_06035 [Phycisphaerales bacterium]|nr:hypothetical protein [Phycisphaerales bacterium]
MIDFDEIKYALRGRGRQVLGACVGALFVLLLSVGAWWWFAVRWQPPPSIFDTPVDDVFGYLAMDDFNQLSLEERMRFLLELSERFRGMESSDSAAMAGFFAGVTGPVRKQLTQNVRILARDILVQGASGYFESTQKDKGKYIDDWVLNWMKTGEKLATGKERDRSDKDRLERIRSSTARDENRLSDRTIPSLNEDGALGFMSLWQKEVEVTASPKQQAQVARFLEDVRKRYSDAF